MTRTLPPLNALRAFEAAGRHESFSRAAEELGVSHSAISRHVRGLEERLGAQLFREISRGVGLTADGRAYLGRISPALDMIAEATDEVAETPAGRVTISAEPLFTAKVVIPRLPRFYEVYPDVELRIDPSHTLADLDRYEADIAIRFAVRGVLDQPADLLSNAPLYPFAAPGLLEGDRITPEDLRRHRLFADRDPGIWDDWCDAAGFDIRPGLHGDWRMRPIYALEAAVSGLGLFLGAMDGAAHDLREGRLVRVSDVAIQSGAFYLIYGAQAGRRKAVKQVRRWLLEETRDLRMPENQPFG